MSVVDRVRQVAPAGARTAPRARYLPIAEHGLIGDLHTVALVGTDGTIDWYCCPRFDSPRFAPQVRLGSWRGRLSSPLEASPRFGHLESP
jgi:GH15 family glucan-1,4-alpha-glucosidase